MSMLTEQTKKLRKVAYEVERVKNDTVGMSTLDVLTLADTAMQLRDAANTIADLRLQLMDKTCQIEQDYDCDEYPQARWWRCHGCGARFLYERGMHPTYCPECGLQRVGE